MSNWGAILIEVRLEATLQMKLKIKSNLNIDSRVHWKFVLKSEITFQCKVFHLQIEKQCRFYFKGEKNKTLLFSV